MPEIRPFRNDDEYSDEVEATCVGTGSASFTAVEDPAAEMAAFRAHALALRDEGATSVRVGDMVVQFGPRPTPPLTAEAVATALAKDAEQAAPVGDEAYVP